MRGEADYGGLWTDCRGPWTSLLMPARISWAMGATGDISVEKAAWLLPQPAWDGRVIVALLCPFPASLWLQSLLLPLVVARLNEPLFCDASWVHRNLFGIRSRTVRDVSRTLGNWILMTQPLSWAHRRSRPVTSAIKSGSNLARFGLLWVEFHLGGSYWREFSKLGFFIL